MEAAIRETKEECPVARFPARHLRALGQLARCRATTAKPLPCSHGRNYFHLPIPNFSYTVLVTVILLIANLKGVDMFADSGCSGISDGRINGDYGCHRHAGTWHRKKVSQPMVLSADWKTIVSMTAVAFWLFIGAEIWYPDF